MIRRRLVGAALVLVALVVPRGAAAQSYEGDTLLRFGAFGQGLFASFGQLRPSTGSSTASGVQGGFSAGIDFSPHRYWTWGLELDAAVGDSRTTIGGVNYGVDYLANLRGRFGIWVDPRVLIYGTGGVSLFGFEAGMPLTGGSSKAAETLAGLTVGLGAEYRWHHVSLFAEYNFANYGSREFTLNQNVIQVINNGPTTVAVPVRHEVDADVHTIRVGIKFNVGHDYHSDIGRHYDP
jgi:opacity protein-like surface antigen